MALEAFETRRVDYRHGEDLEALLRAGSHHRAIGQRGDIRGFAVPTRGRAAGPARRGRRPCGTPAAGAAGGGERIELPAEVFEVLRQVVLAMTEGQAVTVAPHHQTLTTQEAADLLGVSRPTLVRLLEQ